MNNVIDMKEAREIRSRSNNYYLQDGFYYRLKPLGDVFQASREGHYSSLWTLWEPEERLELDVTPDGKFFYKETIFTVRGLVELDREEAKAFHVKTKESLKMQESFDDMDIPF
jgi:hypothetical protein